MGCNLVLKGLEHVPGNNTHTQYNGDNGLTPPPTHKKETSQSLIFFLMHFIVGKNDLSTCLKGFNTGDTERGHKS